MMLFEPPAPPAEPGFELRLDCQPRGKARGRASRSGRKCGTCGLGTGSLFVRTPEETRNLEEAICRAAHTARRVKGFHVLSGPLYALVIGVWPRIQKMPHKGHGGRQWRPKTPDWDNTAKLVLDALNGVAYGDDAQIVWGQGITVYARAEEPSGIEVIIWSAPVFPPDIGGVIVIPRGA